MSDLPAFSGDNPTCPKCGHSEARTRWTQAFNRCESFLNSETTYPSLQRLCRECRRCDYHWDEACLTRNQLLTGDTAGVERVPLGQQFSIGAFHEPGESRVTLLHIPTGRYKVLKCRFPDAAEAAEQPLVMFQALLDEVDALRQGAG